MLKDLFYELMSSYTDAQYATTLWEEIETAYSKKRRYYHTLHHLDNLVQQLLPVKNEIADWDVLLCSIFYHDIVYSTMKKDNEEKSAELAVKRLNKTTLDKDRIEACKKQIIATKKHIITNDVDTDLFTDADLSVLGASPAVYDTYATNVRKEYYIYPDGLYKPGRRKVLEHFLLMDRIYKTKHFAGLYEKQARINLQREADSLI